MVYSYVPGSVNVSSLKVTFPSASFAACIFLPSSLLSRTNINSFALRSLPTRDFVVVSVNLAGTTPGTSFSSSYVLIKQTEPPSALKVFVTGTVLPPAGVTFISDVAVNSYIITFCAFWFVP